jgi:TolB-like protein/tetratricopeptide (TPR) repeat protein
VSGTLAYQAAQEVRDTPDAATAAGPERAMPDATARLPNSIAVLPFANISNDPDNDYFCDGISEEILNALSSFRELNVIGRTSSFAFQGSDYRIDRISAVLGVGHVLQGSVRKAGNQLRISAQLLDDTGRQVWTETFDRELANVFAIQSEIAAAVVAKVAPQVAARAEAGPNPDLEAYDHYLAGRELLHRRDTTGALAELQRAIDIDPKFAEAYAESAIARLVWRPTRQQVEQARVAIDRALVLRPKLLRAQAAQGLLYLNGIPSDNANAETTLRAVIEQDPNMSDALNWLQLALERQGRNDEALAVLERAGRIDPIHPAIAWNLAVAFAERGQPDQAMRVFERQIEQPNPGFAPFWGVANYRRWQGRLVDMNTIAKVQVQRVDLHYYLLMLNYGLLGDWEAAQYWGERSPRDLPRWKWNAFFPVVHSVWRGRYEEALDRFRDALAVHRIDLAGEERELRLWYGALLAHTGEHAAAIEQLEPLIEPNAELLSASVVSTPVLDGQHALAWSYLRTGADAKADSLLSHQWRLCEKELASDVVLVSESLHYCAETALLRGDRDQALTLFERAVAAGWRDYYLRQHDVYWAALEKDPRYRALMAKVKADVDRQAAEIARIDASEDFVAKFDAAMAARKGAGTRAGT